MIIRYSLLPRMLAIACALMAACMETNAADSITWKEEVLLHDGNRVIIQRSQIYGGRHEIGQPSPIKEHTVTFALPDSNKTIEWKSEYSEDVGRANFNLLALHVMNGAPYIVAVPNLCLSYNKWGRPNPPYVLFKYDSKEWKRIQLAELPFEFKTVNVDYHMPWDVRKQTVDDHLTAEVIQKHNENNEPEFQFIVRKPIESKSGITNCMQMVPYGGGGWLGLDWFKDQPTFEACVKFCERKGVHKENCPCETIFKGEK